MRLFAALLAGAMALAATNAPALVVEFEDYGIAPGRSVPVLTATQRAPLVEKRFNFGLNDPRQGFLSNQRGGLTDDNTVLFIQNAANSVRIEGPSPFNFVSFDALAIFSSPGGMVEVIGAFQGGGTTSETFVLPAVGDTGGALASFTLPDRFTNLNRVIFNRLDTNFVALDNFKFTGAATVPLPAALPILASGLAALGLAGWRRRRIVEG
ncbi:MAG: VPLPA-CTERM sorting domain-containing protein [Pseudomonadota bacterium]